MVPKTIKQIKVDFISSSSTLDNLKKERKITTMPRLMLKIIKIKGGYGYSIAKSRVVPVLDNFMDFSSGSENCQKLSKFVKIV